MNDSHAPSRDGTAERARQAVQRLQSRLHQLEARTAGPIAIVGMACRLPGKVRSPDDYWSLLCRGEDAITPIPPDRWDTAAAFDPDPGAPGCTYQRHGGFVDDIDRFDAALFDISPREAEQLDPQQRMLLEEVWTALEDAGALTPGLAGSRTGVFVGMATSDYAARHLMSPDRARIEAHSLTGAAGCIASGRIAYALGLEGPALTVDTACSSSLTAVHLACQSLRDGTSELAIAGGVNALLDPALSISLSRARALSPTGRCRAFDAAGDGFVRSEGCAVIVLRRLDDAIARGDRVYAVIRGSAINNDGKSNGLTAPSGSAQRRLLIDALRAAGVEPHQVGYVEAHGTGTPLGDPIEFGALAAVFGGRAAGLPPLAIGSVKTNLGHLEAAAGIAGLIKLALCVQHGTIPAQLHLTACNPHLDPDARIVIPTAAIAWPAGHARRIGGVSAFGFSGTNAHVVIEQPPARAAVPAAPGPALLALSARSEPALRALARRHAERLAAAPDLAPRDVCSSANTGRLFHAARVALVAATHEQLAGELARVADGAHAVALAGGKPRVGFLFTGQGAIHAGMARELAARSPIFRAELERIDRALTRRGEPSLVDALAGGDALATARRAQPALFAVQSALVALWAAWGVAPVCVIGHSLGEYAAACAAGVWEVEDALALVLERARLMDELAERGSMWAVQLAAPRASAVLGAHPGVAVAVHNGPDDLVVSGADAALGPALDALRAAGGRVRKLDVTHAFHSPQMDPVLAPFERFAGRQAFGPARVAIYSTRYGRRTAPAELASPRYWRDHLREPVQFGAALRAACDDGIDAFVEIGPAPVLLALGPRIAGDGPRWLPSLRKDRELATMLGSLGALFELGLPFDAEAVARDLGPFNRVALPTYPFERRRYWLEPARPGPAAARRPWFALERLDSPAIEGAVFTTRLVLEDLPLVADHRIRGVALVNLVVYLALASEAYALATGARCGRLEELVIARPLELREGQPVDLQILVEQDGEALAFRVVSRAGGAAPGSPWHLHATGVACGAPQGPAVDDRPGGGPGGGAERERVRERVPIESFYDELARRGIDLGPACRGLDSLVLDGGVAIGALRGATTPARGEPDAVPLALIDGAFQATMLPALADPTPRIIVGFHRLSLTGSWRDAVQVRGEQRAVAGGGAEARFDLFDAGGRCIATCEAIRLQPMPALTPAAIPSAIPSPGPGPDPRAAARAPGALRSALVASPPAERAAAVERALGEVLAGILRATPDELAPLPLSRLGVDSFLALELAERIARLTGVRVSLLSILPDATLATLAAEVAGVLGAHPAAIAVAAASAAPAMDEGAI